jgi:hypothetical protein
MTTYQWQDDRTGSFTDVADGTGATTPNYVTAATTGSFQRRNYRCLVDGVPSSSALLTLTYNDVYLYAMPEDADPDDVRLRDPTTAGAVAAIVGLFLFLWPPASKPSTAFFDEDPVYRTDHTLLHRYRVGYQTVGQQQSVLRWKTSTPDAGEVYDVKSARPDLHLYRVGYQTVGQGYLPWFPTAKANQSVEPEQRVDQNGLHRFRTGYQTVGQPFALWPGAQRRVDAEEYFPAKPTDLTPFRGTQAVAAVPGQPWFFFKPAVAPQDIEPDAIRRDYANILLFGRTTPVVVTVGAPWYLWIPPIQRIEPEEDARRTNYGLLHLYRTGYQTVGQPWYLWPVAKPEQPPQEDAQRVDHKRLHTYRVGYQTVGQSWLYWGKTQLPAEVEDYRPPPPANLYPYRPSPLVALPGQPWTFWKLAIADQSVESSPVVTDHAAALYPFRPHQAVSPPVVSYRIFIINE